MNFRKNISNKINFNNNINFSVIIGSSPSKNARSPKIWNSLYKKLKIKSLMYPCDVEEEKFKKLIFSLKKNPNFLGGAITEPYKVEILKYSVAADENINIIGSSNLIKKKKKLLAFNTDFLAILKQLKIIKKKKIIRSIVILGCGGVGRSVVVAVNKLFKKEKKFVYIRNKNNIKSFIKKVKTKNLEFIKFNKLSDCSNVDLLINTTSIGFPKSVSLSDFKVNYQFYSPIGFSYVEKNIKKFKNHTNKLIEINKKKMKIFFNQNPNIIIFDLIYNQQNLLKKYALKNKINYIDGSLVNRSQAVFAFNEVNEVNYKD